MDRKTRKVLNMYKTLNPRSNVGRLYLPHSEGGKDETINHITVECPALAQNQYKMRHDTEPRAVHWNLCKKYQLPCSNKWYEHQPQPVTENENAKLLWNYSIRTYRVIPAHQPDLILADKTNDKVSLIDVAVPWDSRAEQKEQEKRDKYQD